MTAYPDDACPRAEGRSPDHKSGLDWVRRGLSQWIARGVALRITARIGFVFMGEPPCCSAGSAWQVDSMGCTPEKHDQEVQFYRFDMFFAGRPAINLRQLPLSPAQSTLAALAGRPARMAIHTAPFEQGEIGPDSFFSFATRLPCLWVEGLVSKHQHRERPMVAGPRCQALAKIKNPTPSIRPIGGRRAGSF